MTSEVAAESADPNGYDAIPYHSQAFAQTHPDRLATVARLFGLTPPEVSRCRVLELGCAAGGNLIPMAYALPDSEFIGVDLSVKQVEQGQCAIDQLGLTNIRIEHASILDIDDRWGSFDYVLCHGVFSWVPPAVQDKILAIAAQQLSPHGIAYISYNTYPGWYLRGGVRHMLGYHTAALHTPAERVAHARQLLNQLVSAITPNSGPYAQMLNGEIERLRESADWYLFHEVLEPNNTPLYFHQFIERAHRYGLQYLAEAEFSSMLTLQLPAALAQALEQISTDLVQFEQNLDFVRNRHFRQTLLCNAAALPQRALTPAVLHGLYAASGAQREKAGPLDLRPGIAASFRTQAGAQGTTQNPLTKAALAFLGERWPLGWNVEELCDAAAERAAAWVPAAQAQTYRELLLQELLQCFQAELIDLHSWQPPCVHQVSTRPRASAWAVSEAATQSLVTNLRHEVINLLPFSQAILPLLDGQRATSDVLEHLYAQVAAGKLAVPHTTEPFQPSPELHAQVAVWMHDSLHRLARYALLIG